LAELGELVDAAVPHEENDEDVPCPFCPRPVQEKFATYPGARNDSAVLEAIMGDPDKLTTRQANARPKNGADHRQSASDPKPKPAPIFSDEEYGAYSAEAHHLISGNQAMKGHEIEHWIVAGKLVSMDTGYSINNADNGEWLPSIPEQYKGGKWSALSFADKLDIAGRPMAEGIGQFHKGPHNISDKDDPGELHTSYPTYVKGLLTDLFELIVGWSQACPVCEPVAAKNGPYLPNWRIHDMLDAVSRSIGEDLTGPPESWDYFISKLAMHFHKDVCQCDDAVM
jgi:hypothetical protein